MASTNSSTQPKPTENSNPTWSSFALKRRAVRENDMKHDFRLLKDNKSSILGDIRILIENKQYTLDRAILASTSTYFKDLILPQSENPIVNELNNILENTSFDPEILDIIYGDKSLTCVLNENNFVKILKYMHLFKMQIDQEIFDAFFEEIITPKPQLNIHMFELLDFVLSSPLKFNYLRGTVTRYFSDRLLKIYKEKEFLSLSAKEIVSILININLHIESYYDFGNSNEKRLIGRVCAEWICHQYENRITKLTDLVNSAKRRYRLFPYCHLDPNMKIESLKKNHSSNELDVAQVEELFNELMFSHGEAKLGIPSHLNDIWKSMCGDGTGGGHVLFPTDQTVQWVSFLENEILCDVAIIVQGTTFKLHRIKLSSVSGYFYDLFTNPNESLAYEVDKSNDELKIRTHVLDQIDQETFRSIVQYIYRQEIEITSKNHLISLIKGSKFLKMRELFEKCSLKIFHSPVGDFSDHFLEIFSYVVCENGKYSCLYDQIAKKIINLWKKFDENPQFLNISLDVLTEILSLPVVIDNTDQMLDICSKWICHDIQNRYKYTIRVAKAINRNFTTDTDQIQLEIPQNPIDFSLQYVKRQLTRILSSNTLVPLKTINIRKDEQKLCFLIWKKNRSLCVLDSNCNEIIQLEDTYNFGSLLSATVINNELFLLLLNHRGYFFHLYEISSNKTIALASDAIIDGYSYKNFFILNCHNEVYFCGDKVVLKYSVELNRWVSFLNNEEGGDKQYTSDGEKLYKIVSNLNEETKEWENKASYHNFEQNGWIALPNIPITTESVTSGKVNIIRGELSVLLKSQTFSFSSATQEWTSFSNCCENFVEFTADGENILYVSDQQDVHSYSPVRKEWTLKRKLDLVNTVKAIHKIDNK